MANILIGHGDVTFSIKLLNTLTTLNPDVKVSAIAQNSIEALDMLNHNNDIDAFIIDYNLSPYNGGYIFKKLSNRYKYYKSCILLADIEKINKNEEKFINKNIIYEILPKSTDIKEIIDILNTLLITTETQSRNAVKLRKKITEEVISIGYDMSYKGTHYLITAIEFVMAHPNKEIDILQNHLYPYICQYYHTSIPNIKCNINRATSIMIDNSDSKKIQEYFYIAAHTKPRIKTIIDTIVNRLA